MPTVEEENSIAQAQMLTAMRDRARIYREVFGEWDKPTKHGEVILNHLKAKFGGALPPNVLGSDGHTDPYQTWRRLGHFDVLETIRQALEYQENVNPSRTGT